MWTENVKDRYWWVKIQSQLEELMCELSMAEEEEQTDLYLLQLHLNNESDLSFFTKEEQKKIRDLLSALIKDTARHSNLLGEMQERFKKLGEQNVRPAL
ncbi:MAG: hypothetical protein A3C35_05410 [Omnitrophica bacterium RIFCSPHIGHO2_02_FULL_46_11]|nr:MAG: hypothetical protein A3C35_05410 [Omnitrophica bacterium RIFCSPHIGHO2_02_FULL_46_11]